MEDVRDVAGYLVLYLEIGEIGGQVASLLGSCAANSRFKGLKASALACDGAADSSGEGARSAMAVQCVYQLPRYSVRI